MHVDESLRRFGLVPAEDALPEIRALLAGQAEAERQGADREEDLALLCCVQLFSRGLLEDVLRIWDAKESGMDLGVAIDVQLLCGAGLEATRRFLAEHPDDAARRALERLLSCERAGDFARFTPQAWLDAYRRYFRG